MPCVTRFVPGCPSCGGGGPGTVISCCDDPIAGTLYMTTPKGTITLSWTGSVYEGFYEETGTGDDDTDGSFSSCGQCRNAALEYPDVTRIWRYRFDCTTIIEDVYACVTKLIIGSRIILWLDKDAPGGTWIRTGEAAGSFDCGTVTGSYTFARRTGLPTICGVPTVIIGNYSAHDDSDSFTLSD